jgi:hypothetical protein
LIDWETAWDAPTDSDEFSQRIAELTSSFQGVTRTQPGAEANSVRVLMASDQATMDLISGPR